MLMSYTAICLIAKICTQNSCKIIVRLENKVIGSFWVFLLKYGWRGKFLWLIRISLSQNPPESNYRACSEPSSRALKSMLKMAKLTPL